MTHRFLQSVSVTLQAILLLTGFLQEERFAFPPCAVEPTMRHAITESRGTRVPERKDTDRGEGRQLNGSGIMTTVDGRDGRKTRHPMEQAGIRTQQMELQFLAADRRIAEIEQRIQRLERWNAERERAAHMHSSRASVAWREDVRRDAMLAVFALLLIVGLPYLKSSRPAHTGTAPHTPGTSSVHETTA